MSASSKFRNAMSYLGMADIETPPDESSSPQPESEESPVSFNSDTSVAAMAIPSPAIQYIPSPSKPQGASMNRIATICPKTYNDAQAVGKAIRDGVPVILNLTNVEDEKVACRIVDFSSGVAFGLHGSIERVTSKVFVVSPAQVSISGADRNRQHDPFAD